MLLSTSNSKEHLKLFPVAYNFAQRLKTLNGLTRYEYMVKCWQNDKERFKLNPNHNTLKLSVWMLLSTFLGKQLRSNTNCCIKNYSLQTNSFLFSFWFEIIRCEKTVLKFFCIENS